MRHFDIKNILCLSLSTAVILSLGTAAMADEMEVPEEDIEIIEETEETEQTEEEISIEEDEFLEETEEPAIEDVEVSEETEEIIIEELETEEVSEASGWSYEGGDWYYYRDGEPVTGWQEIGGKWYFFDKYFGAMYTGMLLDQGNRFFFDENGRMFKGWLEYDGHWYYFGKGGKGATGWQKINDKWYHFTDEGIMQKGVIHIDDDYYCLDQNGVMQTGWQIANESLAGDVWVYCYPDGKLAPEGWQKINNKDYFFDSREFSFLSYGEHTIDGVVYIFHEDGTVEKHASGWSCYTNIYGEERWEYYDQEGRRLTGWQKINKKWYYLETNGVMVTGMQSIDGETYIFGDNGVMLTGWQQYNGYWYYLKSNGAAAKGWNKIGKNWYYFYSSNNTPNMACDPFVQIDGCYYCFEADGRMATNKWGKQDDSWIYFGSDGRSVSGWQVINGKTYYFGGDNSPKRMFTGFWKIGGELYCFNSNGVLQTGWIKVGTRYEYADKDGVILTDQWLTIGGKKYYLLGRYIVTGYYEIDGKLYYFDKNGVCTNP